MHGGEYHAAYSIIFYRASRKHCRQKVTELEDMLSNELHEKIALVAYRVQAM